MIDGVIDTDSAAGKELGFTSDLFEGWLWKNGQTIYISFIISNDPGKGNLSRLFDAIEQRGFKIAVPTPFDRMQAILKRKGFLPSYEYDGEGEDIEVWRKPVQQ